MNLRTLAGVSLACFIVSLAVVFQAGPISGSGGQGGGAEVIPLGSSIPSGQLDGTFGSEWDDAAMFTGPPFHDFNNPSLTFPTEIRIKHDGTSLYWALQIERPEDFFAFWFFSMFDHDGDGVVFGDGDDYQIVRVKGTIPPLIDGFVDENGFIQRDQDFGGTVDLIGGGSQEAAGGTTIYRMEGSHPLNSGDSLDVAWSPGQQVDIVFGALGLEDSGPASFAISPAGVTEQTAKNGDPNDGNDYVLQGDATPSPTVTGNSSITIQKTTEGNDPREFCFFSEQLGTFCLDDGGSRTFPNLPAGDYTFSEDFVNGWRVSGIGCTPPGNQDVDLNLRRLTVHLAAGEQVTCAYVNTVDATPTPTPTATPVGEETPTPTFPPVGGTTIRIVKVVADGDTQEVFDFAASGPVQWPDIKLSDGEEAENGAPVGTYVISERVPEGWLLADIQCSTDNPQGATFTVDLASATVVVEISDPNFASVTCEFTNREIEEDEGVIRVWKRIVGLDEDEEFGFLPSSNLSPSPFALSHGQYQEFVVSPGEYSVQEVVPDNWRLYTIVCLASDGSTFVIDTITALVIILLGGGDMVDCVFFNIPDDDFGVIEIIKTVLIGDHLQPFEFEPSANLAPANFFLADYFIFCCRVFSVPAGNYSVEEIVPPGWMNYDILCEADNGSTFTISGTRVDIQLGENGDVTCDFGNIQPLGVHYKCYDIDPRTDPPDTVDIQTQFGVETGVAVGDSRYLCPPTLKTLPEAGQEGTEAAPHIECFDIASEDNPGWTVALSTQFTDEEGFETQVGPATMLCAPAVKREIGAAGNGPGSSAASPPPVPHYKCFDIAGPSPGIAVELETQFGVEDAVEVGDAVLLCAPALKTHNGVTTGLMDLPHLVCHAIADEPVERLVEITTQFGPQPEVEVLDPKLLCVPAEKEVRSMPGALIWGDITCEGSVGSLAALGLLLFISSLPFVTPPDCPQIGDSIVTTAGGGGGNGLQWGDVNCDGTINSIDALVLLLFIARLPYTVQPGCPELGEETSGGGGTAAAAHPGSGPLLPLPGREAGPGSPHRWAVLRR